MWKNISYTPEYLNNMVEMTIENYGPDESISNKEFVYHEYFNNPAGNALIELALDEEKMVLAGQYVVNPKLISVDGTVIPAILSLNTLTREAYRGQKIFTSLAESTYKRAEQEGYVFCYGAPNPNSHPGFIKKLSFIDLGTMPLYVRPLCISRIVRELFGSKLLATLAIPFNLIFMSGKQEDESIVRITNENVHLMDGFWKEIQKKYRVMGVRNAEYIKYRYLDVPIREYHPYYYVKDGKVVAYAVGRVREVAHMQCGMIADFLYLDGSEKEAKKLMRNLVFKMQENGAGLAGCIMQSNSCEAKLLKKLGFFRCPEKILPQPTPIIYRRLDGSYNDETIKNWENWFFTTGDYDVV